MPIEFDFRLLDDPDFREDSVREVLIVPLLKALGFSESPPYRIIRSRPLEHPFVYIGTVRKNITIVPDYLLERDGEFAWVLDAKAPNENINSGKHVEQAYSYAIHKDIRIPFYALCNGRKLVLFHVSQGPPVIDQSLQEIGDIWPMVLDLLGCRSAWPYGIRPGFRPDMGLALAKAGFAKDDDGMNFYHILMGLHLVSGAKLEDGLYTVTGIYRSEDTNEEFCVTFDFGSNELPAFLAELPEELQQIVQRAFSRQPYQFAFPPDNQPIMTVVGDIGDKVHTNKNEIYQPFIAEEFMEGPPPLDIAQTEPPPDAE